MTSGNIRVRKELVERFEEIIGRKSGKGSIQVEEFAERFPIIVKKYEGKNTLSCYLQEANDFQYKMIGPFGQGLGLKNSSNESYYFILGGTTMPILDLAYIILQKCMFSVVKRQFGSEEAEQVNPYKQNWNQIFGPKFKVKVLLTLKNIDSFIGRDLCCKVLEICKNNNLEIFDIVARFSELKEEEKSSPYLKYLKLEKKRFDKQFYRDNINIDENIGEVFLCGPHSFLQNVYQSLNDYIDPKKIIIY